MTRHPRITLEHLGLRVNDELFSSGKTATDLCRALGSDSRLVELPAAGGRKGRSWHVFDELGIHALEDHRSDHLLAITAVFVTEDTVPMRARPVQPFRGVASVGSVSLTAESTGREVMAQEKLRFEPVLSGWRAQCEGAVFHLGTRKRRNQFGRRVGQRLVVEVSASF